MDKYKAGEKCEIILSKEMADQLNKLHELGFTSEDCKISAFVFESDRYELLTKLLGNRTIVDKNVQNKKDLLEKNGFKSSNPVIVNTNGQIIDGQHRRMAAEELGINYKFTIDTTIIPEESLQVTIELNNSGKPWTANDYITAYAENGNKEYEKLLNFIEKLGLGFSRGLVIYSGHVLSKEERDSIKEGRFTFEEQKAQLGRQRKQEIDILTNLVNLRYKKLVQSDAFIKAYLEITKKEGFQFKIIEAQFEKMRYTELDRKNIVDSLIHVYNIQRRTNRISR